MYEVFSSEGSKDNMMLACSTPHASSLRHEEESLKYKEM